MPIWVPIVLIVVIYAAGCATLDWFGGTPPISIIAAFIASTGPAMALAIRLGLPLHGFTPWPLWAQWTLTASTPTLVVVLFVIGEIFGKPPVPPPPIGRCSQCGESLEGGNGRYYSEGGYLCPIEYRNPQHRRHRLLGELVNPVSK